MPSTTITTRVVWNELPRIRAGMEQKCGVIVYQTAMRIERGAKALAAVDTGNLRASIQAMKLGRSHWRVVVGAEYGIYVEYGTRFMAAQPFFFPTLATVRPQFYEAMRSIAA